MVNFETKKNYQALFFDSKNLSLKVAFKAKKKSNANLVLETF